MSAGRCVRCGKEEAIWLVSADNGRTGWQRRSVQEAVGQRCVDAARRAASAIGSTNVTELAEPTELTLFDLGEAS